LAEAFAIGDFGVLRPVPDPPGEIELARALRDKAGFSAIGRYTPLITCELSCGLGEPGGENATLTVAWWFLSMVRVRSRVDFLVPAVSNYSWSAIAGIEDDSCRITLLEDIPLARKFDTSSIVTLEHLQWATDNFEAMAKLGNVPKFRLALDCLTTHHHEASVRMAIASIWSGIEAILGFQSELRFRIAATIASFLYPRSPQRLEQYKAIKKLYDFRSRVVHGGPVDAAFLKAHLLSARQLLADMLCKIVELRHIPSDDEWEQMLLTS
jgi:hypothetical protein